MTKPKQTEAQFQRQIMDLAARCGWMRFHAAPTKDQRRGWSTAFQGERGFPDLVLAKGGTVIIRELKRSPKAKVTDGQRAWLKELGDIGQLWTPEDWPEIMQTLRQK